MKRIIFSIAIFSFFSIEAFATPRPVPYSIPRTNFRPVYNPYASNPPIKSIEVKNPDAGFFLKPFLSVEYSAPVISSGGVNSDFKTSQSFFNQLRDIENIAFGANIRVHKFLGFNANWAQIDLDNAALQNIGSLSQLARFRMDQYNFSALIYAPITPNLFEIFAEAGVSDMTSKLNYTTSGGVFSEKRAHETMGIYGAGFQVKFSENSDDLIRFSVQKYSGKLALLNAHYTTVRIGYLKAF